MLSLYLAIELLIRFSSRDIHQNFLCIPCLSHPIYMLVQSQFADFTFLTICELRKSRSPTAPLIERFSFFFSFFILHALLFLACSNSEITSEIMTHIGIWYDSSDAGSVQRKGSAFTGIYKQKETDINLC